MRTRKRQPKVGRKDLALKRRVRLGDTCTDTAVPLKTFSSPCGARTRSQKGQQKSTVLGDRGAEGQRSGLLNHLKIEGGEWRFREGRNNSSES